MKAAYKYQAEDVDELNFEVGEIIQVVEYEDPEEQVDRYIVNHQESSRSRVNVLRLSANVKVKCQWVNVLVKVNGQCLSANVRVKGQGL